MSFLVFGVEVWTNITFYAFSGCSGHGIFTQEQVQYSAKLTVNFTTKAAQPPQLSFCTQAVVLCDSSYAFECRFAIIYAQFLHPSRW